MLDLNLTFVHEDERTTFPGELEESGTSNSSIVNAEGCNSSNAGEGEGDDDSVSVAGDGDSFHRFNFDILKVGDAGALLSNSNDEDRTSQSQTQTRSEFVTQTLFPMSHGVGRLDLGQQVNSMLLFPDNNELQEMSLVQQQKPVVQQNQVGKKSRRGPRSRSSQYRGVTFYRRTGRWESHIWDCGKQVYLGGFDTAHAAARAYDRAAIKFRGVDADINFNLSDYEEDMNQIKNLSKEDFVHILRRHSSGFARGSSKYRGVTMNKCGRWEAQSGQFLGKKVYDSADVKSNGNEVATNFETNMVEGETVSASNYGNNHNLDLNLGISTPSCLAKGSSRNRNLEYMQSNHGVHDVRRLQTENPATTTLQGLPVISEHGQSLTGMYPTFFRSYKVAATNNQMIGGSSRGPSNWAWQVHDQSHTPTTLFTAASSGFQAPSTTVRTNSTVSVSTSTINAPDYNYLIRPPPSPPPAPPPTSN